MSDSPDHAPEPNDLSDDGDDNSFDAVPVRYRHDGWTPDRQLAFIETLSGCGCVDEAARGVGMSRNSAYALRRRPDAQAFRLAAPLILFFSNVVFGRSVRFVLRSRHDPECEG